MEQYNQESIKYGVCLLPGRAVSTSTPVSVTIIVCSNWADSFPSCVYMESRVVQFLNYDYAMITSLHLKSARSPAKPLRLRWAIWLAGSYWNLYDDIPHYLRDAGPVVWPGLVAPHPLVDHGLDGEHVARLHHAHRLVLGVVRHVGRAVEQPADKTLQPRPPGLRLRL